MSWINFSAKVHEGDGYKIVPTAENYMSTDNWNPPEMWCGQQTQKEFEEYVDRMIEHEVRSTIHIGVLNLGNEWYIAKRYQEANMQCHILSVDFQASPRAIKTLNNIRMEFSKTVDIDFRLSNSKKLTTEELGGPFDAAFIDGCHSYNGVKNDYKLVEPIVQKFIGFHDINNEDISDSEGNVGGHLGINLFWNEIKNQYKHEEIIYTPSRHYGIGILYKNH